MKESGLDAKVKALIAGKGGWAVKYWGGGNYTKSGIPDILACLDGWFFGVEDKAKNGRPSALQLVTLGKIRDAGGFGILLYEGDFPNFGRFLAEGSGEEGGVFEGIITHWQRDWYNGNVSLQRDWMARLCGDGC